MQSIKISDGLYAEVMQVLRKDGMVSDATAKNLLWSATEKAYNAFQRNPTRSRSDMKGFFEIIVGEELATKLTDEIF